MPSALLIILSSYLIGAIPVAYIVARLKSVNIFEVGSGNMGTTNVIRAVGPRMGVLVLLLDLLKGVAAILIARVLMPDHIEGATVLSAVFAIVGHNWSIFARIVTGRLRGGKGAATALGTFVMVAPIWLLVLVIVIGLGVLARTRYMSLAVLTMVAVAAPTLVVLVFIPDSGGHIYYAIYALTLTSMILYRFRENIQRLLAGNERRVGERA